MIMLTLLAAGAASVSQPLADKAGVADDVRCMAAFMLAAGASKDKEQASAIADTLYYLGRIDQKAPGLAINDAVTELVAQTDYLEKQAADDLDRCAKAMNGTGDRLQGVGKAMAALDKGEPAPAAATAPASSDTRKAPPAQAKKPAAAQAPAKAASARSTKAAKNKPD